MKNIKKNKKIKKKKKKNQTQKQKKIKNKIITKNDKKFKYYMTTKMTSAEYTEYFKTIKENEVKNDECEYEWPQVI